MRNEEIMKTRVKKTGDKIMRRGETTEENGNGNNTREKETSGKKMRTK